MATGMVGADLATLDTLKTTLDTQSSSVQDVMNALDKAVDSAVWTGKNAEDFKASWKTYRKTFVNVHSDLTDASKGVKDQRDALAKVTGEA